MAFVHRLVVVGFIVASFAGFLAGQPAGSGRFGWDGFWAVTLILGGGFAFMAYVITWLCRGTLLRW